MGAWAEGNLHILDTAKDIKRRNKRMATEAATELAKRIASRNNRENLKPLREVRVHARERADSPVVISIPGIDKRVHLSLKQSLALREALLEAELKVICP